MVCTLIQDSADGDLLCWAFGPEALLQSLVFKAKACLGLSSSTFSTPLNPISTPTIHITYFVRRLLLCLMKIFALEIATMISSMRTK
ncbi:hypothetical protein V6N13_095543 [Hibiscus sabdariffa]|uniref:AtC3H46-like PABC-like domain-containing protein n=2 Tax=Hibiscus sabdariffa TaxID=183260 RepID=A0ABR2PRW2_9ROSI